MDDQLGLRLGHGLGDRYVRLRAGCHRFKRFTDSCRGNGKVVLELAGVDLPGADWRATS